ncbi:MAG TPA: dihydrodipicolinate synthase family protein [Clostridiaceae bacterium]|nr:dihydrodipicolinate synthase family protein [Clostridiaceae bacterium]
MNNIKFTGIIPAIVSPLNEDGTIKEKELRKLVRWHLSEGCTGFYICGANGEGVVMKPESRKHLAEIMVDEVKGKGYIIDHVCAVDLRTAMDLARHASDIGVDAVASLPPFFYHYGDEQIYQYYKAISDSCDVPVMMYAASYISGTNMPPKTVEKMMGIERMIGLKWTSSNYFEMRRLKELNNGNINVLNGSDETLICGLVMGADGGIGATYNIMPKMFVKLYNAFVSGNIKEAQEIQYKVNKVIDVLLRWGVGCGVKDTLEMIGYEVGKCTYPLKRFTDEEQKLFRAELKALNFEQEYL